MPYSSMGANLKGVAWEKCRRCVVVMTDNGRRLNGAAEAWDVESVTLDA